jgi:hypothetical protein
VQTARPSRDVQQRFLTALVHSGKLAAIVDTAGLSDELILELRKQSPEFSEELAATQFQVSAKKLEETAHQRAIDGVLEPVVSSGTIVRDDENKPISTQRHSDYLLIELLKANFPEKFHDLRMISVGFNPRWLGYAIAIFMCSAALWIITNISLNVLYHIPLIPPH